MTSMLDVVFILLIFVMVAMSFQKEVHSLPVVLPKAKVETGGSGTKKEIFLLKSGNIRYAKLDFTEADWKQIVSKKRISKPSCVDLRRQRYRLREVRICIEQFEKLKSERTSSRNQERVIKTEVSDFLCDDPYLFQCFSSKWHVTHLPGKFPFDLQDILKQKEYPPLPWKFLPDPLLS